MINSVVVNSRPEALTYSIVSNSNSSLVTASLTNERLNLSYADGQTGSATLTVRATDQFGATADASFTVTVEPLAISTVTNPVNLTNDTNATVSGMRTDRRRRRHRVGHGQRGQPDHHRSHHHRGQQWQLVGQRPRRQQPA